MKKQYPDMKPEHSTTGFNDPEIVTRMLSRCLASSCDVGGVPVMCKDCGFDNKSDEKAFLEWEAKNKFDGSVITS